MKQETFHTILVFLFVSYGTVNSHTSLIAQDYAESPSKLRPLSQNDADSIDDSYRENTSTWVEGNFPGTTPWPIIDRDANSQERPLKGWPGTKPKPQEPITKSYFLLWNFINMEGEKPLSEQAIKKAPAYEAYYEVEKRGEALSAITYHKHAIRQWRQHFHHPTLLVATGIEIFDIDGNKKNHLIRHFDDEGRVRQEENYKVLYPSSNNYTENFYKLVSRYVSSCNQFSRALSNILNVFPEKVHDEDNPIFIYWINRISGIASKYKKIENEIIKYNKSAYKYNNNRKPNEDVDPGTDPIPDLDPGTDPDSDLDPGTDPVSDLDPGTYPDLDPGTDPVSDLDPENISKIKHQNWTKYLENYKKLEITETIEYINEKSLITDNDKQKIEDYIKFTTEFSKRFGTLSPQVDIIKKLKPIQIPSLNIKETKKEEIIEISKKLQQNIISKKMMETLKAYKYTLDYNSSMMEKRKNGLTAAMKISTKLYKINVNEYDEKGNIILKTIYKNTDKNKFSEINKFYNEFGFNSYSTHNIGTTIEIQDQKKPCNQKSTTINIKSINKFSPKSHKYKPYIVCQGKPLAYIYRKYSKDGNSLHEEIMNSLNKRLGYWTRSQTGIAYFSSDGKPIDVFSYRKLLSS